MNTALFLIITTGVIAITGCAEAFNQTNPFHPGEKLTYSGRWGAIPAGEVTLEVLPRESIAGIEAFHFAMTTKTNQTVDRIYKIRERQDSYVDTNKMQSVFYTKITDSKHPSDIKINFDWNRFEATRSNFGKESPPIKIMAGSVDPLALFFILRLQTLQEDSVIEFPITDGKRNIMVKAAIDKKEWVTVKGKTYETFVVTPDMERLEQIVSKSKEPKLKIWISSDTRRLPVKIRSSVGIITFVFELKSIEP